MKVVVIGGGAAGLMAAAFSASSGADTSLLERTPDGGRKILISGGGRCNVLPASLDESRFVTDSSPHLLRRLLRSWPLAEQVRYFERDLGVALAEEPGTGKLFPRSQRARDIRDALVARARASGVRVITGCRVADVFPSPRNWSIALAGGGTIDADRVVLATGGLSVPSTGSDGTGLEIARRLGHAMNPTYAALTPLLTSHETYASLSGISLTVSITAKSAMRRAAAAGGFLFTHRGYSGPAVLDVSHVAVRSLDGAGDRASIVVNWTGRSESMWDAVLRAQSRRTAAGVVSEAVPRRLADVLVSIAGLEPSHPLSQLDRASRIRLTETLVRFPLPWFGHEGYRKAEVTGGGVSLSAIDPTTLESRVHPGLYFCGEMLDAFGPIGGYNFFWAWATARLAGISAARTGR